MSLFSSYVIPLRCRVHVLTVAATNAALVRATAAAVASMYAMLTSLCIVTSTTVSKM
jgi:hypothetical protein